VTETELPNANVDGRFLQLEWDDDLEVWKCNSGFTLLEESDDGLDMFQDSHTQPAKQLEFRKLIEKVPCSMIELATPCADGVDGVLKWDTTELVELIPILWTRDGYKNFNVIPKGDPVHDKGYSRNGISVFICQEGTAMHRKQGQSAGDVLTCRWFGECSAKVVRSEMRIHVAKHILKEQAKPSHQMTDQLCGFCGSLHPDCEPRNEQTTKALVVRSPCPNSYAAMKLKTAVVSTPTGPCCNVPVYCKKCEKFVWRYNWTLHWNSKHKMDVMQDTLHCWSNMKNISNVPPVSSIVSQQERDNVLKFSCTKPPEIPSRDEVGASRKRPRTGS
jgi:hypothetical protein